MTTRTDLAAAAQSVPAVASCSPYFRTLIKAGDACVKLARMTAAENGFGYVETWQVLIALPQDNAAAEKWLETNHPLIAQALEKEWVPTTVTPAELVFDATTVINGVIYEGTR